MERAGVYGRDRARMGAPVFTGAAGRGSSGHGQPRRFSATADAPRSPYSIGVRATLVAIQIALSVVLLVGAGLLGRGFIRLMYVDPGFDSAAQALTFRLALPRERYRSHEEANVFSELLRRKLAAMPFVTGVGAISHLPFDYVPNWSSPYAREGAPATDAMREADARAVTPEPWKRSGHGSSKGVSSPRRMISMPCG